MSDSPDVGDAAPEFELPSSKGGNIKLADYRDKSSVILIFYPGDSTIICSRQLCSLTESYDKFQSRGFTILGIGVDSMEAHKKFVKEKHISFPLLVDANGVVCTAYGVYRSFMKIPHRSIFMIDKHGIIKLRHVELTRLLYKKADAVLELIERAMEGKTQ